MVEPLTALGPVARRWWRYAALVLLCALLGFGYERATDDTYTAQAYVAVVPSSSDETTAAVAFAQAYARIAVRGEVVAAAATASRGAATAAQLRANVRASSSPDAPIVEIAGSATDPDRAADLANRIAGSLVGVGAEQANQTRMRLVLLSPATPPDSPTSMSGWLAALVGAAIGVLLAAIWLALGGRAAPRLLGPRARRQVDTAEIPIPPPQPPIRAAARPAEPQPPEARSPEARSPEAGPPAAILEAGPAEPVPRPMSRPGPAGRDEPVRARSS